MKDDTSLKESIATLANMTRQSMEKDLQIENIKEVNAEWTSRYGWHLKKNVVPSSTVWQDDYK